MSKEYESEADRRDEESKQQKDNAERVYDEGSKIKKRIDNLRNKGEAPDENSKPSGEENASAQQNAEGKENTLKNDNEQFDTGDINTSAKTPQEHGNISSPDKTGGTSNAAQTGNAAGGTAKSAGTEVGKEAGKEAGKEVGKEIGKEAGKQAVKEGAKAGAEAAAASTGVGVVAAAAIEAADKIKDQVKGIGETSHRVREAAEEGASATGKAKATKPKKAEKTADDNTAVKLVILLVAIIVAVVILIVVVLGSILLTVIAPVIVLYNAIMFGYDSLGNALADLNGQTSFEGISYYYQGMIDDALKTSFEETCYNEVLQIAKEQDYDEELTMESFAENSFPYILDGENCNVNYLEIMAIFSMSEQFNNRNFKYDEFKEVFSDTEFLRCLYDLKVERDVKEITNDDGKVIDTKVYGKVTINRYPVTKLFNYFGIDPYGKNRQFPSMTNYQALKQIEGYSESINRNVDWGAKTSSTLFDYSLYTGEITEKGENIYADQMYRDLEIGDYDISNGVPCYAQGDPRWGDITYLDKTIRNQGCCLTSMSMITTYFSGQTITPDVLTAYNNEANNGRLVRSDIAAHYGFHQYVTDQKFTANQAVGELAAGRLLIVKIPEGHKLHPRGHFMVITGCDTTSEEPVFHINDPAGGKQFSWTASECAYNLTRLWSYGM